MATGVLLSAVVGVVGLALYAGCLGPHGAAPRPATAPPAAYRAADVEPLVICYDPQCYCSHPREVLFQHFAGDELILGHYHAACRYQDPSELDHYRVQDRCVVLMQRSHDGGRTWPKDEQVVLFDQRRPPEQKQAFLYPGAGVRRRHLDMFQPDAVFFFGRTFYPPDHERVPVCFALRSVDRGRTWEEVPTVISYPGKPDVWVHRHAPPVIRLPDGKTLDAVFQAASPEHASLADAEPAVFRSTDDGESWQYLSRPIVNDYGAGRFTYAALLLRPCGTLQCYALHIAPDAMAVDGIRNSICLSTSADGGAQWTPPVAITDGQAPCWNQPDGQAYKLAADETLNGRIYRSPWPVALRDGRVLVVFARRRPPYGIGGVVSADDGRTWSEEFVIRTDSAGPDMGYPVGCELDDGRIFVAYYAQADDRNPLGGTRYIAGVRFRIEDVR